MLLIYAQYEHGLTSQYVAYVRFYCYCYFTISAQYCINARTVQCII